MHQIHLKGNTLRKRSLCKRERGRRTRAEKKKAALKKPRTTRLGYYWPNRIPTIFSWPNIFPIKGQHACWLGGSVLPDSAQAKRGTKWYNVTQTFSVTHCVKFRTSYHECWKEIYKYIQTRVLSQHIILYFIGTEFELANVIHHTENQVLRQVRKRSKLS